MKVSRDDRARSLSVTQPVAVAQPVAGLITGPLQPATILAAHSAALVLCLEPLTPISDPTRVVTVLTAEASGVPNGVWTALHAADRPFRDFVIGDAAFIGAGGIQLPNLYLRAVRTVRTAVPRIRPTAEAIATIATAAQAAPRGLADEPVTALSDALASGNAQALREAVRGLVGLGTGSTPGGDDVLSGTLAALHATRRTVLADNIAAAALPDLAERTPLMSADLLRLAARGHVCSEVSGVLRAAGGGTGIGTGAALNRALSELLSIGHTSGADLATGLAIGLTVPAQPEPRRPRVSRSSRQATSGQTTPKQTLTAAQPAVQAATQTARQSALQTASQTDRLARRNR